MVYHSHFGDMYSIIHDIYAHKADQVDASFPSVLSKNCIFTWNSLPFTHDEDPWPEKVTKGIKPLNGLHGYKEAFSGWYPRVFLPK